MTPERQALLPLVTDTAESARERLLDPRNVSKGGWDHLSWPALTWLLFQEVFEFVLSLAMRGRDTPRHEAGDVLVLMAFMRQKAEGLREEEEEVPKFEIGLEPIERIHRAVQKADKNIPNWHHGEE